MQTILKDVCYENIDCILKLLDESGAENSTVVVLKKTERSFKGKCYIFTPKTNTVVGLKKTERSFKGKCCIAVVLFYDIIPRTEWKEGLIQMYWYFLSTKTTEIYCLLKVLNIFGSLYTLFEEKIMQSSWSIFDFI